MPKDSIAKFKEKYGPEGLDGNLRGELSRLVQQMETTLATIKSQDSNDSRASVLAKLKTMLAKFWDNPVRTSNLARTQTALYITKHGNDELTHPIADNLDKIHHSTRGALATILLQKHNCSEMLNPIISSLDSKQRLDFLLQHIPTVMEQPHHFCPGREIGTIRNIFALLTDKKDFFKGLYGYGAATKVLTKLLACENLSGYGLKVIRDLLPQLTTPSFNEDTIIVNLLTSGDLTLHGLQTLRSLPPNSAGRKRTTILSTLYETGHLTQKGLDLLKNPPIPRQQLNLENVNEFLDKRQWLRGGEWMLEIMLPSILQKRGKKSLSIDELTVLDKMFRNDELFDNFLEVSEKDSEGQVALHKLLDVLKEAYHGSEFSKREITDLEQILKTTLPQVDLSKLLQIEEPYVWRDTVLDEIEQKTTYRSRVTSEQFKAICEVLQTGLFSSLLASGKKSFTIKEVLQQLFKEQIWEGGCNLMAKAKEASTHPEKHL